MRYENFTSKCENVGWNLKSEEKFDTNDFNILRFLFHVSSYSNFT